MLNEGCSVESSDGARRGDADGGAAGEWKSGKSCVNTGCGVGPAGAGGGSHVCCVEAVVDGGVVFAGCVSRRRGARGMSEDSC